MEIQLKIISFEDKNAVLRTENGRTIIWPREHIPETCLEGETLFFSIRPWNSRDDKKKTAEEILNEILNADEEEII